MPITPVTRHASPSFPVNLPPKSKCEFIGTIHDIREAFPAHTSPGYLRGAMQGEGVVASYQDRDDDNFLYSLNAQTCVIATLYNPANKTGALIHFDHNITDLIDDAVNRALRQVDPAGAGQVNTTLTGGMWILAGERIGDCVKQILHKHDLNPSWNEWSFSPCTEHSYGAVLDLKTGNVTTFEHRRDLVETFMTPLLLQATTNKHLDAPDLERARTFMQRFKLPPIAQGAHGLHYVHPDGHAPITARDIEKFRFDLHRIA